MDKFKGNAIIVQGEHVNADTVMGWYLGMDGLPPQELASKFLAGYNPEISKIAKKDDILVCGRDFGFGKVHNALWTAMRTIGIKCIVAESFSTQMIQSGLLNGVFLAECPDVLQAVNMGDEIEVDIENSAIYNITRNERIAGKKTPQFLIDVMNAGGQIGYLARKVTATSV